MGTVTAATLVYPDGREETVEGPVSAAWATDGYLAELRYAYGQALIPAESPAPEGMWRYQSLLPLEPGPILYPLAVGGTPLLSLPGLRAHADAPHLYIKDETRSPTGSNKDRATGLVLEHALRTGVSTVTAASTGNVAVSLAVGAAASGIRAVIFVPASVAEGKLRLMLLAGATVFRIQEGYDAAYRLSRHAAREHGWYDRNTGANPLTLEAKKTAALEIWEQLGRRVPDAVVVPVGDGTSLSAMYKGFWELVACGVADRVPRMIGVQAEGCSPLHCLWRTKAPAAAGAGTIADGIAVTDPVNGLTAVRDVRRSEGAFVTVSDEAILEAVSALATRGGVLAEPAAAAGYAGLLAAIEQGLIGRGEVTVVHITGSGLKTPQYLQPQGSVHLIHADPAEVARALNG